MIHGHKKARILQVTFSSAKSARLQPELVKVTQLEKVLFLLSHLLQAYLKPAGEFNSIFEWNNFDNMI